MSKSPELLLEIDIPFLSLVRGSLHFLAQNLLYLFHLDLSQVDLTLWCHQFINLLHNSDLLHVLFLFLVLFIVGLSQEIEQIFVTSQDAVP